MKLRNFTYFVVTLVTLAIALFIGFYPDTPQIYENGEHIFSIDGDDTVTITSGTANITVAYRNDEATKTVKVEFRFNNEIREVTNFALPFGVEGEYYETSLTATEGNRISSPSGWTLRILAQGQYTLTVEHNAIFDKSIFIALTLLLGFLVMLLVHAKSKQ